MSKSKNVVKKLTTILFTVLFTLVSVFAIGPTNVNAETTDITEINLTGNYQYGTVPAGILPAFNPGTTTDSITIDRTNSSWEYKMKSGGWSGFGLETPVAYNDGKTDYGYSFAVDTKEGYQLASDLKVIYNGEDVTSTVKVTRWAWGAYVDVDLGKAIGENPTTHTVTFNSNGGTEIAPKEVVSGLKIKAPSTPTKDKYVFRGWYEDSTFSKEFDFNTLITSDMTLYANWEAANSINEIRLAGDIQYGTVQVGTLPSFNPGTTTDSITIDKTNSGWMKRTSTTSLWGGFASNTPVAYNDGKTNYGYDFCVNTNDGYQLASDLKVIYNGDNVTTTANVSRWAWGAYVTVDLGKANGTPVVYTITFNSNDGTPVAPQNINAGEKLKEPTPAPTREGFTFDGWYEDSTFSKKFDFNTPITDSMTLYAKWTENKYTLTFDANGGTGSMTAIADLTGEYILPSNEFTAPSGKQFKGWSLTTDGAIVTKVDMTENRTVYAIWENIPVVTYTVSFAANGGTGTMTAATGISGNYTLPACTFTAPAGKQFKAWSVGGVEKAVGDKITVTANTTVTAVWEPIPVTTYDLTTQVNGGHGTISASKTGLTAGSTETITFTPDAGYKIDTVTVNGTATSVSGNTLNVTMNENKTVIVTYKATGGGEHTHSYGSEWKNDADNHWYECSCGDKTDVAAHTASDWIIDTPATATTSGSKHKECTVCGYTMATETIPATGGGEHTHSYGSDWKYDADNHWHECSCGDKADKAAHDFKWVVDKEATATQKGSKHEECKVCGYKKAAVEILATGSTTKPTDPTQTNSNTGAEGPKTGDNSNMILWIALLFISGGAVIGITVYSKKKKENAE